MWLSMGQKRMDLTFETVVGCHTCPTGLSIEFGWFWMNNMNAIELDARYCKQGYITKFST